MPTEITDQELAEIGAVIKKFRNIDICSRKSDCIKRRIAVRMRITDSPDLTVYCSLLQQNGPEMDLLLKILTIHVSQFFRNPSMFEKLKEDVLPALFTAAHSTGRKSIQIYSLGCAGGEEPYSMAILLNENFTGQLQQFNTSLIAIDVDSHTLQAAELAEFIGDKLKNISDELRHKYFIQNGSVFKLVPEISRMVSFLKADITSNLQLNTADLVLCRNTLIYFTRPAQEMILNNIADLLSIGGVLVLGKSETMVGILRKRFEPVCRIERIYRKLC
jgi:chemotaxis protein methyltransferase CheR